MCSEKSTCVPFWSNRSICRCEGWRKDWWREIEWEGEWSKGWREGLGGELEVGDGEVEGVELEGGREGGEELAIRREG